MNAVEVSGRRAFHDWLQDSMAGATERWERTGQHRKAEGRAKSYLLDVHQPDADVQRGLMATFESALSRLQGVVTETQDAQFYRAQVGDATLFIDAFDSRFVTVHSTGLAEHTDRIVEGMTSADPRIDSAWLPTSFLNGIAPRLGTASRREVHFDSTSFWAGRAPGSETARDDLDALGEVPSSTPPGKQFAFNAKGTVLTAEVMRALGGLELFADTLSISRIDIARVDRERDTYVVERVYKHGKLAAVGSSADDHLNVVAYIRNEYAHALRRLEAEYTFGMSGEGDLSAVEGHPINITFENHRQDMFLFAKRLFSGSRPFMLWGLPNAQSARSITVHAVDLHVQQAIYIEIVPSGLRIYLNRGSCANTVARLYTNILSYVDARAQLWGRGEGDLLLQG